MTAVNAAWGGRADKSGMSNVVHLGARKPQHPVERLAPTCDGSGDAASDAHIRALAEIQHLCQKAVEAGGLAKAATIETDLMVALYRVFQGTEWAVRFHRRPAN